MAEVEKLDSDEVQRIVKVALTDAYEFNRQLSDDRAIATEYYLGEKFGNEKENRSQVIMTEVRDAVSGMLPSILRVFTAGDRAVEYTTKNPARVKEAKQITDYVMAKLEQGGFFRMLQDVSIDGLVRKLGSVKMWWDDTTTTKSETLYNVTEEQLQALGSDDTITIDSVKTNDATQLSEVEYTQKVSDGEFRFEAMPPEEFLHAREARCVDRALVVAHRSRKTQGELVAMGVDEDEIEEHGSPDADDPFMNADEQARLEIIGQASQRDPDAGEANRKIEWTEAYVHVDVNGDGEAELRKFTCLGTKFHIVGKEKGEPVDYAPFATFTPYPEPHAMIGQSLADRVMDMQLYKSMLWRGMSDSAALSTFPRMAAQEGNVSIADLLNTDLGAPIRTKGQPQTSVMSIAHDFVGEKLMPLILQVDEVIERRTGQNKGAQGLDSDAMQSSTQQAVGAALAAGQQQIELICRNMAEQLLKPMLLCAYKMFREYQPKAETVKINGEWVEMDPSLWDDDLAIQINVGLGTTDTAKKAAILTAVATDQTSIYEKYGPSNPMVTLSQIRNTRAQILALNGYADASPYYNEIPDNWQPPPAPPPQKSPAQIQVEGELQIAQMKTDREYAMKQAELQQEERKMQFDQQLALAKLAQDSTLRRYAIDAQFKSTFTQQQFDADAADTERQIQGHLDAQQQSHSQAVDAHNQALASQNQQHQQELAQAQQQHDQQIAQQQADAQQQQAAQGGTAQS